MMTAISGKVPAAVTGGAKAVSAPPRPWAGDLAAPRLVDLGPCRPPWECWPSCLLYYCRSFAKTGPRKVDKRIGVPMSSEARASSIAVCRGPPIFAAHPRSTFHQQLPAVALWGQFKPKIDDQRSSKMGRTIISVGVVFHAAHAVLSSPTNWVEPCRRRNMIFNFPSSSASKSAPPGQTAYCGVDNSAVRRRLSKAPLRHELKLKLAPWPGQIVRSCIPGRHKSPHPISCRTNAHAAVAVTYKPAAPKVIEFSSTRNSPPIPTAHAKAAVPASFAGNRRIRTRPRDSYWAATLASQLTAARGNPGPATYFRILKRPEWTEAGRASLILVGPQQRKRNLAPLQNQQRLGYRSSNCCGLNLVAGFFPACGRLLGDFFVFFGAAPHLQGNNRNDAGTFRRRLSRIHQFGPARSFRGPSLSEPSILHTDRKVVAMGPISALPPLQHFFVKKIAPKVSVLGLVFGNSVGLF